jgi:glyoxylase-like metal-dependent hydrolase (beta-lactamase superfamily II)
MQRKQPYGTEIRALVNNGAADLAHYLTSTAGALPIIDVDWEEPDLWLRPGETLQSAGQDLQTFATPGHTRGHMVMVADETGVIFVRDHVLPHITSSIGLEPLGNRSPLADYMWSLDAMTTLPDLALLPGHGPAGGSLHARAAELRDHHRDRLEQSRDCDVSWCRDRSLGRFATSVDASAPQVARTRCLQPDAGC